MNQREPLLPMMLGQFFTVALANVESIKQNPNDVWTWAIVFLTIGAGLTNTWRAYFAMPTQTFAEEMKSSIQDSAKVGVFFLLAFGAMMLHR